MFFIIRGGCRDFKRSRKNKKYLKRYTVWYNNLTEEQKENYQTVEEIEEEMAKTKGEMRAHSKKKNKFAALRSITKKIPATKAKGNFWGGKLPTA